MIRKGVSVSLLLMVCFWLLISAFIPRNEGPRSEGNFRFGFGRTVIVEEGMDVDSAVAVGGDVQVYGHVRKDVAALGGSVYLAPFSRVDGNVTAMGGRVVHQDGAMVGGKITAINPGNLDSIFSTFSQDWFGFFSRWMRDIGWISSMGFILLALIIAAVMPSIIGTVSFRIEQNVLGALFLGVLGSMAVFPILMMLFISLVGIVLVPLELMLVGGSMIIGYIAVSQLIGKRMTMSMNRPNQPLLMETVLGLAILFLVGFIPFFGFMAKGFVALLGFGGVIDAVFFGWTRRGSAS